MEQVSQGFMDDLRGAHGSLLQTHQLLNKVVAGKQFVPFQNLVDTLHSMSCEAFLPRMERPKGFIFGSGPANPLKDIHYKHFTGQLARDGHGLVTIANTQASQLIERTSFTAQLRHALEASGSAYDVDDIHHGYFNEDGERELGLWDDISRGYAKHAHGMVITVTPNACAHRVFVRSELPELIVNESVESINALSREMFLDYFDVLRAVGVSDRQAYKFVDDDLVKGSSVAFLRGYSEEFQHDLGITMRHDFHCSHGPDVSHIFDKAHPRHTLFAANDTAVDVKILPGFEVDLEGAHHH